ncbi:MAG: 16S rRNA (adenine(1518)-N(6)/adenine(1519)-N(6))-dimethyltransferase RsmA [Oligoflexia bacterium]|nr:16S rRNA (adenine(1518)-N(6)/adenine(1519)-N(6))-dimethyltransferase RsmA [Oligoflexia bacterium]
MMNPAQTKRRALGQHFLRDQSIASEIATTAYNEARKTGCSAILEIGPGRAAITDPLLDLLRQAGPSAPPLMLCERDVELAAQWQKRAEALRDQGIALTVESADFLQLPEEVWLPPSRVPLAVMSNLPYSAGTAILTRMAAFPEKIPVMVLMFQAEVARRVRAEPDTKAWGSLSIWIQNRWDVEKLLFVPPAAFNPPPKVDSEVVVLRRRAAPRVNVPRDPASEKLWEGLLHAAFAHRRKMLRSGLPPGSPYRIALDEAGLDGTKRAEALSWDEWSLFFTALKAKLS